MRYLALLIIITGSFFVQAEQVQQPLGGVGLNATAQVHTGRHARRYVRIGVNSGVYQYYGWYPYTAVVGYPYVGYAPFGYSFWPYFNYAPQFVLYAAIAYDVENNIAGTSFEWPSREQAERAALQNCGADGCRSLVWVQGGCAAIAIGQKVKGVGWGYGSDQYTAKRNAQKACQKANADRCVVRALACSG